MFHTNKEEIKILRNKISDLQHEVNCFHIETNDLKRRTTRHSDVLYALLDYLEVEYVEEHINEIRKKE